MKRIIKWVIVLLILGAAGYALYTLVLKPKPEAAPIEPPQVISFQATQETMTKSIQVKGKSKYEQETLVYAPYASKVTKWRVENGGQVKKGEVLFTLDQTALRTEIEQQEANIRKAELEAKLNEFVSLQDQEAAPIGATEAERLKMLADQETKKLNQELNEVTAQIQQREIADKKKKLSSAVVHAPASGIFLFENATEIPQMVTDNQYIGKIVNLSKLQFIAVVGEQDIFSIKKGMQVSVSMTAKKDLKLKGTVLEVSKFALATGGQNASQSTTQSTPQFEVVISLEPNEHLIGGLSLTGEIETVRKEKVTAVPTMAVMREPGAAYVMIDKGNGQTERRDVKTGMETLDKVEIIEGLKPGDTVVLP